MTNETQDQILDRQTAEASAQDNQSRRVAAYLPGVPINCRNLFQQASAGKGSPRSAIKSKCQSCVGFEEIVDRIRDCSSYLCPLWQFRPYQVKQGANA